MTEVVVTTVALIRAKFQLNDHHQQINIELFTSWMHFLSPKEQCQRLKENITADRRTNPVSVNIIIKE